MLVWNAQDVRDALVRTSKIAYRDIDACKSEIRSGKDSYKQWHDRAVAEQMVSEHLSVSGSIASAATFSKKLFDLREDVDEGRFDTSGLYDVRDYRAAAVSQIDKVRDRFLREKEGRDVKIDPLNNNDGIILGDILNDDRDRSNR